MAAADLLAGVDEAGRGPLAGPVVAAAVVLDPTRPISGIDDSKKLNAERREVLSAEIERKALGACVALATVAEIDAINILQATLLAMQRAVRGLPMAVGRLHVDGKHAPQPGAPQAHPPPATFLLRVGGDLLSSPAECQRPLAWQATCIVGGDGSDAAIGAASILAKVHRDRLMEALDATHPGYGFAQHRGYGTRAHIAALESLGPCLAHRRTFAPVRRLLEGA